jgi:hypothetical protein
MLTNHIFWNLNAFQPTFSKTTPCTCRLPLLSRRFVEIDTRLSPNGTTVQRYNVSARPRVPQGRGQRAALSTGEEPSTDEDTCRLRWNTQFLIVSLWPKCGLNLFVESMARGGRLEVTICCTTGSHDFFRQEDLGCEALYSVRSHDLMQDRSMKDHCFCYVASKMGPDHFKATSGCYSYQSWFVEQTCTTTGLRERGKCMFFRGV